MPSLAYTYGPTLGLICVGAVLTGGLWALLWVGVTCAWWIILELLVG